MSRQIVKEESNERSNQADYSIHIVVPCGAATKGRADVQALFDWFCLSFPGDPNGLN